MTTQSRRGGTCHGPKIRVTPPVARRAGDHSLRALPPGFYRWSISGACQVELRRRQRHVQGALGQQGAEAQVYNVWIIERT